MKTGSADPSARFAGLGNNAEFVRSAPPPTPFAAGDHLQNAIHRYTSNHTLSRNLRCRAVYPRRSPAEGYVYKYRPSVRMSFAEPIWARGHVAARRGRTHDRFRTAANFAE
jgi:hypothetical protein